MSYTAGFVCVGRPFNWLHNLMRKFSIYGPAIVLVLVCKQLILSCVSCVVGNVLETLFVVFEGGSSKCVLHPVFMLRAVFKLVLTV